MDFEPGQDEEKTGATDANPEGLADEPMLWCPVCSSRLTPHKCKLVCEKCGYYMSCADYY